MALIVIILKKQYKHPSFNSPLNKYPFAANNKKKSLGKYLKE
jgi:hypothetical protein